MVVKQTYIPDDMGQSTRVQYIGELEDLQKAIDSEATWAEDMEQFDDVPTEEVDTDFWESWLKSMADETITNEFGGKQSKIATRLDLIPPNVQLMVGMVLADGAVKYGEWNWKLIPSKDHLAHALEHIYNNLQNKDTDELIHAICRLYFAAHMNQKERP